MQLAAKPATGAHSVGSRGRFEMEIYDIKLANRQAGQHFFEPGTMRFFDSRIGQTVYEGPGGVFFTTSEQFHGSNGYTAVRKYTVRRFDPKTGHVTTMRDFNDLTRSAAVRVAQRCADGLEAAD